MKPSPPRPDATPKGYWKKADGTLVPEKAVKPVDRERTRLVEDVAAKALAMQKAMTEYKLAAMGAVDAFVARAAAEHGVKAGGVKGNLTLPTFDGSKRVLVQIRTTLTLTSGCRSPKPRLTNA